MPASIYSKSTSFPQSSVYTTFSFYQGNTTQSQPTSFALGSKTDNVTGYRLTDPSILRRSTPFDGTSTAYQRTLTSRRYTWMSCTLSKIGNGPVTGFYGWYGGIPAGNSSNFAEDTGAASYAFNQIMDKVNESLHGSFDHWLSIGEMAETKHFIAEKATEVYTAGTNYKRAVEPLARKARRIYRKMGNCGYVRRLSRRIAGRYAQFVWAVLPLIGEIEAAAKDLAERNNPQKRPPLIQRQRTRAKSADVLQKPSATPVLNSCALRHDYAWTQETEVSYHSVTRKTVSLDPSSQRSAEFLGEGVTGRGLKEFIPTIWDLLPLSFAVGFVANVDVVMKAYAFNTRDALIYAKSSKLTERILVSVSDYNPTYWGSQYLSSMLIGGGKDAAEWKRVRFQRTVNISPMSQVRFSFKIPTPGQWAGIAALGALLSR